MFADVKITDDLPLLLAILPPRVRKDIEAAPDRSKLVEVVLDLGKPAEARFDTRSQWIEGPAVSQEDIDHIVSHVGEFTSDNRAGIERTLHRISGMRNRHGKVVGITCRVGRAAFGTIEIIRDVIESGQSILFLGPPGIGKTTKLREAARVISDELKKRVVVVDTSNEIAGDGDIPHTGIGRARRMQVQSPDRQHAVMIEAVENHMPEVIIIDEIGTVAEAAAARTIAERGVQLIGTAHGSALENLLQNPTLSDLIGGVQTVILSDEEAKRRRTQKAILERKAPPTFDILVEIRERDVLAIYRDVAMAVDKLLRGHFIQPEMRIRKADGRIEVKEPWKEDLQLKLMGEIKGAEGIRKDVKEIKQSDDEDEDDEPNREGDDESLTRIFPYAVNRGRLERAIHALDVPAKVARSLDEANIVLTTKSKARPGSRIIAQAEEHGAALHVIRGNTAAQIMKFLKFLFKSSISGDADEIAVKEVEDAIEEVRQSRQSVDLSPQNSYIRRLQHQVVARHNLRSESIGQEPKRRIRIYPE